MSWPENPSQWRIFDDFFAFHLVLGKDEMVGIKRV